MATASSTKAIVLRKYLERRQETLYKFHPQWDFTNEEIKQCDDLLKRNLTPICIPPSWDLVQKYSGALDENADGYDEKYYKKGKRNFVGDQGEAEFLDLMRNLEIGGILIGDVNSQYLFYGHEFKIGPKEYFVLPSELTKPLSKYVKKGIFHIEVKKCTYAQDVSDVIKEAHTKTDTKRSAIRNLIQIFLSTLKGSDCGAQEIDGIMNEIISVVFVNGFIRSPDGQCAWNLIDFFRNRTLHDNALKNDITRNLLILFAGFRPDFYISPIQCALTIYRNIFSHDVNLKNFYSNNVKFRQNIAITVDEFLGQMKFLPHKNINFGQYQSIYLTKQQIQAVGCINAEGDFQPRKQIICGPPGSGKSLILMLKAFILAQINKNVPLCYYTRSKHHKGKLRHFMLQNKHADGRELIEVKVDKKTQIWNYDIGIDLIIDKDKSDRFFKSNRAATYEKPENYLIIVITGPNANRTTFETAMRSAFSHEPTAEADLRKRFQITELSTIFRSTKQIQDYLHELKEMKEANLRFRSGHNFEGVKHESYILESEESLKNAVEQRLSSLINEFECNNNDIGLYYPVKEFEREFAERFPRAVFFSDFAQMRSLEFPIMVIVNPARHNHYLLASRAICHLIVFSTIENLRIQSLKRDNAYTGPDGSTH